MADHVIPIEAPARSPRLGGIRTVAEFASRPRLGLGGELEFTSPGCDFPVDDIALCYPTPGVQAEKESTGIETLYGVVSPFGLYAAVECFLHGDDFEARARALLEQGEDRGIEKRMNDYFTSLTGIVATDFVEAMAAAEDYADSNYLGKPVIWINRGDAFRSGKIRDDTSTGVLFTPNGTPVIASGKIAADTVAVTGSVLVAHTETIVNTVTMHTTNREKAIAERIYAVALDCEFAQVYDITS